jgi:hypothetical protein
MQGMQNYPGRVPAGNVPNRPMGPPLRQDLSQRMPPGYDQSMLDAITGATNAASNVFGPKGPARVDQPMPPPFGYNSFPQQGPSLGDVQAMGGNTGIYGGASPNYNPYQQSQPQQLGLSQLSNMSGDQLPQYLNQMRQAQQPQQMQPQQMQSPQMQPQQMPQPSANMKGQYRLSPGVYGTREQAMRQYQQQMQPAQFNPSMYQRGK